MYCLTCGESIPDDSVYCSTCGRRVDAHVDAHVDADAHAPQVEEEPVEHTGFIRQILAHFVDNLIIIVLLILLLLTLGALAGMGTTFLRKTPLFHL